MMFKSVAWFHSHSRSWLAAALWLTSVATAHAADVSIHLHTQVTPRWVDQVAVERLGHTVVYHQPVRVYQAPVYQHAENEVRYIHAATYNQPILIHAPKKHRRHWKKHCHRYHACGRQVQFVEVIETRNDYSQDRQRDRHKRQRVQVREEHRHYHSAQH